MHSTDRPEFEAQLAKLCAGLNVPMTDHRRQAYWTGLCKMSIVEFVRCVDELLGENGGDKFPSTYDIWQLHKQLRNRGATIEQPQAPAIVEADHVEFFANRLLFGLIVNRGGLGSANGYASAELEKVLDVKRQVVAFFCELIREGHRDATPAEFVNNMRAQLCAVIRIEQATLDRWRTLMQHPDSQQPFPASMGRERSRANTAATTHRTLLA